MQLSRVTGSSLPLVQLSGKESFSSSSNRGKVIRLKLTVK